MDEYKTCTKCGQILMTTSFSKSSRSKDGLAAWCKECNSAYQKQRLKDNPDKDKATKLAWKLANEQKVKAYEKSYYQENKERLNQSNSEWRKANIEQKKKADKQWAINNPQKVKINGFNWRLRNPEKVSLARQLRRARLYKASLFLVTSKDIRRILAKDCLYCGQPSRHIDHIVPLSRGGLHSVGNLAASCEPCNLQKNNKTIMEWRVWKKRLGLSA